MSSLWTSREITQLSTQSDTDFRVVGMNWVQGQLALCVEGTLPPHIAQGILKNSTTGLWDRLKSLFGTSDTPEETAAEVPVRVWIGLFSLLPVKYEIDATQLMQQIVQKNQEDGTISRYAIGLEIVGYNDIQGDHRAAGGAGRLQKPDLLEGLTGKRSRPKPGPFAVLSG